MDLLTAVNEILPKLGERPVTSVQSQSPTLAVILPQITAEIDIMLMSGWWFNTSYDVDLMPDSEGTIMVPLDTLSFVPNREYGDIVVRGQKFYNVATRNYVFKDKIRGMLIQRLAFDELPESAARYVLYAALVTIYATDIGLEQVVQLWRQLGLQAQALMEQEHLRHKHYTVRQDRRYMRLRRAMRG